MKTRTALILGAGSSLEYGYPTGAELRRRILGPGHQQTLLEIAGAARIAPDHVYAFLSAFRLSRARSIDAFLATRGEFTEIGKLAIANILLLCEDQEQLMREDYEDDWYGYLVNQLAADSWEAFNPSWLNIVTFNYDRSLEHLLCVALMNHYGKSRQEVTERLRCMKFAHVYGVLGDAWHESRMPYGCGRADKANRIAMVYQAAQRLKVIPEGRDDDATLEPVRQVLDNAKRICFLGFSYDQTNLRRLGIADRVGNGDAAKDLYGTCYGMKDAEVRKALSTIGARLGFTVVHQSLPQLFKPLRCEETLRTFLVLD